MCGRYRLDIRPDFADRFMLESFPVGLQSNYNMAPGTEHPVIIRNSPNHIHTMLWGLIPRWSLDGKPGVINARVETLTEKPMFAPLLKHNRCIVPATGFYEWKKSGGARVPYYFQLPEEQYFSFASLYSVWINKGGKEIYSYTIITTSANNVMQPIHDRMPVILQKEDEQRWLEKTEDGKMMLPTIVQQTTKTALYMRAVTALGDEPN